MAYQLNIFLVLAKSLMKTPDIIMKTRLTASVERQTQIFKIEGSLSDPNDAKLQTLKALVDKMKKEYVLVEHYRQNDILPVSDAIAEQMSQATTRLIIVAHGDADNPRFLEMDEGDEKIVTGRISPDLLASWVRRFLREKPIERISLHICSAAKEHPVSPGKASGSFALPFAKRVGALAKTVSARTGSVTTDANSGNRVTSLTGNGIHDYRESSHKLIYSTGPQAKAETADYAAKVARDLLLQELLKELTP